MQLIDIGANLTHSSFQHDLDAVVERARAHGVCRMVITGASREGSPAALELARKFPGLMAATAGIHPHHASEFDAETDDLLRELVAAPEVRAVGETGLDYHRDLSPRPTQLFAFERQLEIALDCGKPLFLHQRDAHADFISLLKPVRDRLGAVVVHCFTGTREELFDYLDLDCHIGITGWICDERRGTHLREIVGNIPANRLMIETDSPYLLPRNLKPMPSHRRNEPMFLGHICAELARDRGESLEATAAATTATAMQFFGLD
ncbi:TatD family hydrolase [Tahibacter amnicola]|uniref:TatD family hydrolase n=1 Tax=Tahibacter amnicola TaxID=2976241 RepID=A0ABY6BFW7_9GAMM|nr:TatD family hydrolase [Tahibacter amnicola]UXI68759.1 TatD family hydrolase [Tahibacter amnicola]